MKKRAAAVLMGILVLCILAGVTAFAGTDGASALKEAKSAVPSGCTLTDQDHDVEDHEWEFEFRSKNKKTRYEVVVSDTTGRIIKVEMEKNDPGAKRVKISKAKAKKAVRKIFKKAVFKSVKKKKDDGRYYYKVKFVSGKRSGNAEVNAGTGSVMEWTLFY